MKTEDEITWKQALQDQWFYKLWNWIKKQKNNLKHFTKKEISKGEKAKTKS